MTLAGLRNGVSTPYLWNPVHMDLVLNTVPDQNAIKAVLVKKGLSKIKHFESVGIEKV